MLTREEVLDGLNYLALTNKDNKNLFRVCSDEIDTIVAKTDPNSFNFTYYKKTIADYIKDGAKHNPDNLLAYKVMFSKILA